MPSRSLPGNHLPEPLLAQLSEFVAKRLGLSFPRARFPVLERALAAAAKAIGFDDAESCARRLVSSPLGREQAEVLSAYLTVGETYFFREPKSFEILEQRILPQLIDSRRRSDRRLRIWCAGCCTGEEAYSIAILLDRMVPDLAQWNVSILATDLNPRFLEKAAQGVYTQWSFRGVRPQLREAYFTKLANGRHGILPRIRRLVSFACLNLAEDSYPSLTTRTNAMDLILCRNVLMYFVPERAQAVAERFHRALVEGGWLVVSPVETSSVRFASFASVSFPGAIFYRKTAAGTPQVSRALRGKEKRARDSRGGISAPQAEESKFEVSVRSKTLASTVRAVTDKAADPYDEALKLYQAGRYGEAVGKSEMLLASDAGNARAMTLLARAHANQGRLTEALAWCEKAVAAQRLSAGNHYLLATIRQERNELAEAATAMRRALYLEPDFVLAHFALGSIARLQGRPNESSKHFSNALASLERYRDDEILAESEGMTAGRLRELATRAARQEHLA